VGRPREHDERTASALLAAAENLVESDGADALSLRRVADAVGTSTRAVYSLFGSKEGLLAALGNQAWELVGRGVAQLPVTDDPAEDLVKVGTEVFRDFAINHPSMFGIAVQRTVGPPELADAFRSTRIEALHGLQARVERLSEAGRLDDRPVSDAVRQFHALCEGLAALELRGVIPRHEAARTWHDALGALVTGFASPPGRTPRHRGERRRPAKRSAERQTLPATIAKRMEPRLRAADRP
jgi:AcrR family transcriptional regulator